MRQWLICIHIVAMLIKGLFPWFVGLFVAMMFYNSATSMFVYYPLPSWVIFFTLLVAVPAWVRREVYPLLGLIDSQRDQNRRE